MKKTTVLQVLLLLFSFTINAQNSTQIYDMSDEEALLFFLKINNVDPDETTFKKGVIDNKYTKQPNTWTKSYLEVLDSYNYKVAKKMMNLNVMNYLKRLGKILFLKVRN